MLFLRGEGEQDEKGVTYKSYKCFKGRTQIQRFDYVRVFFSKETPVPSELRKACEKMK